MVHIQHASAHIGTDVPMCADACFIWTYFLCVFISQCNSERLIKSVHIFKSYCKNKSGTIFTVYSVDTTVYGHIPA